MEIGKLNNILIDLDGESLNEKIQPQISNLASFILNNNSDEIEMYLQILKRI